MNIKLKSFTMAEILLSLTIIGVVAAITLPSLTGNINERTWRAQRKALYARMSQALALMGNINGYGVGETNAQTNDNAAKAFVTNGLSKVLKINNICDSTHLQECGIPAHYKKQYGNSAISFPTRKNEVISIVGWNSDPHKNIDTKIAAFETANGESVAVIYNPYCVSKDVKFYTPDEEYLIGAYRPYYVSPYVCANFIFDLNGKKGPNRFGKDMWYMAALYADRLDVIMIEPERLAPMVADSTSYYATYGDKNAKKYCASIHARLGTVEEGIATFYNDKFAGTHLGYLYNRDYDNYWVIYSQEAFIAHYEATQVGFRCIYTDGR